jgi:hypothetical protein
VGGHGLCRDHGDAASGVSSASGECAGGEEEAEVEALSVTTIKKSGSYHFATQGASEKIQQAKAGFCGQSRRAGDA